MSTSSSPPLAKMRTCRSPASSRSFRACAERNSRSPLSSRMPSASRSPSSRITSIAVRTPARASYVSTRKVVRRGEVGREGPEGLRLGRERLDVRVRHGAGRAQTVAARRGDVAGRREADDRRVARDGIGRVGPLRPAEGEVDDLAAARRQAAPGRLRGEHRVERDLVQQEGLDELALGERGGHLQERLARVDDASLGDGPDVAGEPERGERLDVLGAEPELVAQVREILLGEPDVLEEPEARLEPRRDQEAAARREPAHEEAERGGVGHPAAQVARRHVQLVEVGRQRARHRSFLAEPVGLQGSSRPTARWGPPCPQSECWRNKIDPRFLPTERNPGIGSRLPRTRSLTESVDWGRLSRDASQGGLSAKRSTRGRRHARRRARSMP